MTSLEFNELIIEGGFHLMQERKKERKKDGKKIKGKKNKIGFKTCGTASLF